MQKVNSLNHYKQLLIDLKGKGKISITNNYTLGDELLELINNHQLFFVENIYGLVFYLKKENSKEIELRIMVNDPENHIIILPGNYTYRITFTYRNNTSITKVLNSYMEKNNFNKISDNFEMRINLKKYQRKFRQSGEIKVKDTELKDINDLITIFKENLNTNVNEIPSKTDVIKQ